MAKKVVATAHKYPTHEQHAEIQQLRQRNQETPQTPASQKIKRPRTKKEKLQAQNREHSEFVRQQNKKIGKLPVASSYKIEDKELNVEKPKRRGRGNISYASAVTNTKRSSRRATTRSGGRTPKQGEEAISDPSGKLARSVYESPKAKKRRAAAKKKRKEAGEKLQSKLASIDSVSSSLKGLLDIVKQSQYEEEQLIKAEEHTQLFKSLDDSMDKLRKEFNS